MPRVYHWVIALNLVAMTGWCSQPSAMAQPAAPPAGATNPLAPADSPLLFEPKAPEAIFDAVVLMVDLVRPKLAREYLEKLLALNPSDAAILKMRDKHGPAVFLKLSNSRDLQPESIQLLDRMNAAFRKGATDPKRVDSLIAQLSGAPQEREVAIIQLRSAGPVVLPRLLQQLTNPAMAQKRDLILYTLTRLGKQMIPPLLGGLDAPDLRFRTTVVEALGWLGDRDVAPYLWFPAFAAGQPDGLQLAARQALARILHGSVKKVGEITAFGAAGELERIARTHFRLTHEWDVDADGLVEYWAWTPAAGTVGVSKLSPTAASLHTGSRFAWQAVNLAPERRRIQALYLGLALAASIHEAGWDQPIPTGPGTAFDLTLTTGVDVVSEVLRQGLDNANTAAALGALEALGQIGTRDLLYSIERDRSPIIAALNYPDGRVQFAAAATVLQIDPDKPFRGSTRVVDILQRALNDSGSAHCLVVDVNAERGGTIAGMLQDIGYDPVIAPTGQDGFRVAVDRGDVELIVLQSNTIRWPLSQTVANLRADARTARIPIAIMGPESDRASVDTLLRHYPLTTFVVASSTTDNVNAQLKPFLAKLKAPKLTQQQRADRIDAAAYWLAHISNGQRSKLYNIAAAEKSLFQAVNDPKLAGRALFALAAIPTPSSQVRLKEVVDREAVGTDIRETAALQLAFHIQRFGLLLSTTQVREVETIWQTTNDPVLKTALASVIGSLKPNAKRVGDRLRNFPQPIATQPQP